MNDKFKDKLMLLRQRVPVGLRDGLLLLEAVGGDLEKAEEQFKEEMIALAVNKTGVTTEVATSHLIKCNFDITLAIKRIKDELKSIDDARYTVTELILRDSKNNKERALDKIMCAVEERFDLKREFWLLFEDLKVLPGEVYGFMVIMEWLSYEDYEGYDYALSFHLDLVINHIKDQVALTDLAESLQQASDLKAFVFKDFQDYNELREHEEYKKCEKFFKNQRPLLLERLCELVKSNVALYP